MSPMAGPIGRQNQHPLPAPLTLPQTIMEIGKATSFPVLFLFASLCLTDMYYCTCLLFTRYWRYFSEQDGIHVFMEFIIW